jgi:hypothetical protein
MKRKFWEELVVEIYNKKLWKTLIQQTDSYGFLLGHALDRKRKNRGPHRGVGYHKPLNKV